MASRRRRRKTIGKVVSDVERRLRVAEKRPGAKRIKRNVVTAEKIQYRAIVAKNVATDGITPNEVSFGTTVVSGTEPTEYLKEGTTWVVPGTGAAKVYDPATDDFVDLSAIDSTARASADGKNTIYRQNAQPTGGTYVTGDTWFDEDDGNKLYRYDGTTWVAFTLGNSALASISATKILAGSLDANVIVTSNLDAGQITTGTMSASRITAGSITATQISSSYVYAGTIAAENIAAGTITAAVAFNAASGTFSGTVTATTGRIGGWYLTSTGLTSVDGAFSGFYLQTNGLASFSTVNATGFQMGASGALTMGNGTISGFSTLSGTNINTTGSISSGTTLTAGTTLTSTGTFTASGTSNHNGQMNYTGVQTGSGTQMVLVTTGSRVAIVTSSERFKQDIKYITTTGWLDKVLGMRPITYKTGTDYITEGEPNETQYGFLAEDIYDLGGGLEKTVVLDPLGEPFSLSYERFTVFLTLAIKEINARLEALEG